MDPTQGRTARLAKGFVAGALSVLVFHQGMLAILHAAGVTPSAPLPMGPTSPFGIPQVLSLMFWGGVWGMAYVTTDRRLPRGGGSVWAAALFGAIAPTLVAGLVVSPLKGQPVAFGGAPAAMLTAVLVNAAWGAGTALLLMAVRRLRSRHPAATAPTS